MITKGKANSTVSEPEAMTETLKRLCAMVGNNVGKAEHKSERNRHG